MMKPLLICLLVIFLSLTLVKNPYRANSLFQEYSALRNSYSDLPLSGNNNFDTELVRNVILNPRRGKSAGIDGLAAEHILQSP